MAVVDAGAPFRPHLLHTATAIVLRPNQAVATVPAWQRKRYLSSQDQKRTRSGPTVDLIGVGIGLAAGKKKTLSCFVLDARGA